MENNNNNTNFKDIEDALLGLILVNKKIDDQIAQAFIFLDKDYFSTAQNQETFLMFKSFYDENIKEFDIPIISKYVNDHSLNNVITTEYLSMLMSKAGYSSSINYYLSTLNEGNIKKQLGSSLKNYLNEINDSNSSNLIESIRNELYKIEDRKISSEFQRGDEVAKRIIEDIFSNKKEILGLKTGFTALDEITTGLQKGDLIILAARPSVGKTAFALNLAMNAIIYNNNSVAFFSLEMPAEQLMKRMLSSISSVNNYKFKDFSTISNDEKERILAAYSKLENKNLFIDDSGSINLNEIIWKSKKLKNKNQLDLIIIDYMQLIPVDTKSGGNRQQEVSKISRSLKQLARELDVPIIALSQLNRRVEERESKKPMMSDLRESGSIEQDADIIAFLYRDDYYNKSDEEGPSKNKLITELNIAKHRNGSTGTIEFLFDSTTGKFNSYKSDID